MKTNQLIGTDDEWKLSFLPATKISRTLYKEIMSHLNQLHEVLKVLLFVNGELAVVVDDAIVLHLAVAADAQGVITGIVGALTHQEQARLRRVEEPLGLLPSYLPMKPATGMEDLKDKRGEKDGKSKTKEFMD